MTPSPLSELLARQGFVVLDGGLATELEVLGSDLNDPLWSAKVLLEQPQLLAQVNEAYLRAGADVVVTASYQATIPGFLSRGMTLIEAERALRKSVAIARQVRDLFWEDTRNRPCRLKPLVVASVGPYGAYLHDGSEYRGHYGLTRADLKDFHRERLAILLSEEPDLLAFESFPSQLEAEAVVDLLKQWPDAACWISFTCQDERCISEGTSLSEAVGAITESPQVLAVGVNCAAPWQVETLLQEAASATGKPLVAYPNSGTWDKHRDGRCNASFIEEAVISWYDAGARLIGGCCRVGPTTIQSIRAKLMSK